MSRRWRRGAALAAAVLGLSLLAACGLPAGGAAEPVDPKDVPYGLLAPTPVVSASAAAPGTLRAAQPAIYLLTGDTTLVPVAAPSLPLALTTQDRLEAVLRVLAAGPAEPQRNRGLGTALTPGAQLELVQLSGSTAEVRLVAPSGKDPSPERLPLAIGQIVLTATSVPGVDAVQMVGDGQPAQVPLPGGALTSRLLHRSDYTELLTAPTPSPTPSAATSPAVSAEATPSS